MFRRGSGAGRHVLILLGVVTILAGCDRMEAGPAADAVAAEPRVTVMWAQPVERPVAHTYPGRLAPFRRAEVRARVAGILMERLYTEGQDVAAGDLLFRIDDAQLTLDVAAAKSAQAKAEAEYEKHRDHLRRHDALVEKKVIPEHEYIASVAAEREARAETGNAAAALERAELLLSYARVTAPISGRVGLALVSEGALVGQGEPTRLTVIDQVDPLYVDFAQPASDLAAIDEGVRKGLMRKLADADVDVRLLLADGGVYGHRGRLTFIDSAVNPETDSLALRAEFPNPDKKLLPGSYVRVTVIRATRPEVYLVPRDSLVRQEEGGFLMILSPENVVERREVEAVEMDGRNWVVTSGLKPGDRIIVNGAQARPLEGQKAVAADIAAGPDTVAAGKE